VAPQGRDPALPFAGLQPTIGHGAEKNCEKHNQEKRQEEKASLGTGDND
jgi:hypothetical protein